MRLENEFKVILSKNNFFDLLLLLRHLTMISYKFPEK